MAWFEKEMDYARENLTAASESIIERAGARMTMVMRETVEHAGKELREVVGDTSREIDAKLDKISDELHAQRQFTKDDVRELVDYAADRVSVVLDQRIAVMKNEISSLVAEKTEYFKTEIDTFFIRRQHDLARERRRLAFNILLAFTASITVGAVSLFYKGLNELDMLGIFRIVLASLAGGYGVYLVVRMINYWSSMAEHEKDMVYVATRYWGWLRPGSIVGSFVLLALLTLVSLSLLFPEEAAHLLRLDHLMPRFRGSP